HQQFYVDAILLASEIIQKLSSGHLKSQLRTLQLEMALDITSSKYGKTTLTIKQLDGVVVALMAAKNTKILSTVLEEIKHGIDKRFDKNRYIDRLLKAQSTLFS